MSAPSPRRAVLTGLGLISVLGSDADSVWNALLAGKSGVRRLAQFDAVDLPCRVGAEIPDFDAKKIITQKEQRKTLKVMARTVQLGVAAAQKAVEAAELKPGQIAPARFGVEFACVMVATEPEDMAGGAKVTANKTPGTVDMAGWGTEGIRQVPPLWMLKYLPNMPACHVSVNHDAKGPNNTITASDAAGLLALGEAYRIIGREVADAFLVGGCESKLNPVSFARHTTFHALTRHNDAPEQAVRPFDATRDGTALGEGGIVLLLEELEGAKNRGATVDAELVGYASGFDRGRKGPVLAGVIRNAMKEAGVTVADIDHVNAGAGGVPELDAFEARGIHEVFGTAVPVVSYKPHFGSLGAASGLVELAVSVLALNRGELPGTLNYTTPDPACPVSVHVGKPRPVTKPYAVKVSYTDLGQCAAVVVKKGA
jgi:3-oxoacyl-[acyl-carrier-protein] synthase II